MQAGILKERIQVQRPTVRTDEYGANVIEYNNIINTRAAVTNKSGNRANENAVENKEKNPEPLEIFLE